MEGRFGNIVLTANRVDPFIRFGLSQNTNDLLRAVLFLFHEPTPYRLRNSLALTGANQGSHANPVLNIWIGGDACPGSLLKMG